MAKKTSTDKKPTLARRQAAELPEIRTGDIVNVHVRIVEGDKERIQQFEGTVIGIRGAGPNKSFTVRKISRGYGIERIFPYLTPAIAKVEVKRHSRVRRSKLYYLRHKTGRDAMLKERKVEGKPRPKAVAE